MSSSTINHYDFKATAICIFNGEIEFLDLFIEHHLSIGFSKIIILNAKADIDLSSYNSKHNNIEITSLTSDVETYLSKYRETLSEKCFYIDLHTDELFHYQYPEIISLNKFLNFIYTQGVRGKIQTHVVEIEKPEPLLVSELDTAFRVHSQELRKIPNNSTSVVIKLKHDAASVLVKHSRRLHARNEILSFALRRVSKVHHKYEKFIENEILDNIRLKDYITKDIPPRKKKNDDYQKFIIIGPGRSGTNLLCTLLDSHPQIACARELFNKERIFLHDHNHASDKVLLTFRKFNELYFLKHILWHDNYPSEISAVGFKVLAPHQLEDFPALNDILSNQKNLKVIISKRANYLARMYSLRHALMMDQWVLDSEEERVEPKSMRFDRKDCQGVFEYDDWFYQNVKETLEESSTEYIEVPYESMAENTENEMERVLDFLDLSKAELHTDLKKQNTKRLSEVIENYSSLKNYFKNTKWQEFFVD